MTALTTRASKGTALTYTELDANWTELDRRTGAGWNDLVSEVTVGGGLYQPQFKVLRNGLWAWAFDPSTMNECFATFHLRHDYKAGTEVLPHVHWTVNTTNTGTVRWGVEYSFARRQDLSTGVVNFPATQTLYVEMAVAANGQYRHFVTEPADGQGIVNSELQTDGLILCRFFRDAEHVNDTFPDDAYLLTVDCHYQTDQENTPLRYFPFNT